ncbi:hypothetical protein [Kineococcus rubinsiae]|uniref:hypothetical protein n=1 Tax=Kineococcus rubinsiae TaxID=2609562 RepID=UPI00142FB60C|nr:hypothetical protein [Kineococcus rubinsiae]NIZ90126.1 hypothetical protein [Kineococcus rubinsiae]
MAGFGSSTLSIASVMAAQAYVATRPATPKVEEPAAAALTAPEPAPADGTVAPVGDARRFRHWSALGAARRAVL